MQLKNSTINNLDGQITSPDRHKRQNDYFLDNFFNTEVDLDMPDGNIINN